MSYKLSYKFNKKSVFGMVFEVKICKSFSSFICTPPFWLTEVARLAKFFWSDITDRQHQAIMRLLYTLDTFWTLIHTPPGLRLD